MDLSALGSTLPPGLADAEREMGDKFRASALSITNLYKSSLGYTKQAYQVGYSACLADVLSTVQSSIGAGQDATQTLSRLMDWAEARETAMAAFAAEEGDDPSTPHNTHGHPHPRRQAAQTRHQIHLQAATAAPRPSSAPIPESHYSHRTPHTHISSDNSPGPSRLSMPAYGNGAEGSTSGGQDPDMTYVHGSTPLVIESSPAGSARTTPGPAQDDGSSARAPASSPTISNRTTTQTGSGRISRSPLRYRHESSSASTSFTLPSIPFAPSLPSNLSHGSTQQSILSLPAVTTAAIPIGSKRPITAVHLDPDLDVAMTDDGMSGLGSGRGGRAAKRRNLDRRGESREAREGESGGDGGGKEKEREERKRGRKGKDTS